MIRLSSWWGQTAAWGKLRREPQRSIERAETLMRVMGLEIAIIEGLINTVIGRRIAEICCRSIRIRSYRLLEHV